MADIRKSPAHKPRLAARKRVLFGGKIVHDDGAFSLDCTIRDLSDAGARITLGNRVSIPAEVYLIDLRAGVAYRAQVAWRRTPNFGLRFVERIDLAAAPAELAYLARLWNASRVRQ
ncbi:MAG TPA: PilZ domain-containing protein [Rhizomicrobium sp.]